MVVGVLACKYPMHAVSCVGALMHAAAQPLIFLHAAAQGAHTRMHAAALPRAHTHAQTEGYRGDSLTRKCTPLGPFRRLVPRFLGGT